MTGEVFKATTHVYDAVTIRGVDSAGENDRAGAGTDYDIPQVYGTGPGAIFDIRLAYNVPVTGLTSRTRSSGVHLGKALILGTPTPYKWVGASPPNIHSAPEPADLGTTDWEIYPACACRSD